MERPCAAGAVRRSNISRQALRLAETISETSLGEQIFGGGGIVLEPVAQLMDEGAEVLDLSFNLMLALAARDTGDDLPGGTFAPPPPTFAEHPINLLQFRRHAGETWKNMSVGETLGWLAARWGVDMHLRVALSKLRYRSSEDTFRIKPVEGRLVVKEAPQPSFTGPRLKQALQILHDINALDTDAETGMTSVTPLGYELLEECGV